MKGLVDLTQSRISRAFKLSLQTPELSIYVSRCVPKASVC